MRRPFTCITLAISQRKKFLERIMRWGHRMRWIFLSNFTMKRSQSVRKNLSGDRPERLIASHHMAELWTTFARTGRPAAVGQPEWPAYNFEDRPSMRIDTRCEVINDRFSEELGMWRAIGMLPVRKPDV